MLLTPSPHSNSIKPAREFTIMNAKARCCHCAATVAASSENVTGAGLAGFPHLATLILLNTFAHNAINA